MQALIKSLLIKLVSKAAIKAVFSILMRFMSGIGLGPWIAKHLAEKFAEDIAIPVTKYTVNMSGYYYNRVEGKTYIGRLEEAKEENDEAKYNSTVDDILN